MRTLLVALFVALPLWVPARVAFDKNGELRPDLFEPGFRRMLEKNRDANADRTCHTALGAPVIEDYTPKRSLDDVTAAALTILTGDVVSSEPGFYNGTPGTLFQIAIRDVVRSVGQFRPKEGVARIFIADATLATPRGTICAREPFAAAIPVVGDRVLLFSSLDPVDAERQILPVEPRTQLVVEHAGKLYAPAVLGGSESQSLRRLLADRRRSTSRE